MTSPEAGRAVIFNRPFGPQCVFGCPRGQGSCSVECEPTPGEGPRWKKHGSDEQPTLTPSIYCTRRCGWHGYVQKGVLSDAPGGLVTQLICAACHEPEIVVFSDGRPLALTAMRQLVFNHKCAHCGDVRGVAVDPPAQLVAQLLQFARQPRV